MKTGIFNEGMCGVEQVVYLGSIAYNTTNADTGVALPNKIPKGFVITKFVCDVKTAFNAATTNVVTLGTKTDDDAYMGSSDITEGTVGGHTKSVWIHASAEDSEVYAKYTQTGTAATAGAADFYAYILKLEV